MQSRQGLVDTADKPIDRTAIGSVPHRLLVLLANSQAAIQSPALIECAKSIVTGPEEAPYTPFHRTEVLSSSPAATTAGTTVAVEGTTSGTTKGFAAATTLFVHKDSTMRSIVETLLENDPKGFLETLLNISPDADESASILAPLIRYAYQVVLPAALYAEKHGIKVNTHQRDRQATKFRRTEQGLSDTTEGIDYAATTPSGVPVIADPNVTPGLQDCISRPNHPGFLLYHALTSWDEAKALAERSSPVRKARALLDALSICNSKNIHGLPRKEYVEAARSSMKAALQGTAPDAAKEDDKPEEPTEGKNPDGPSIYTEGDNAKASTAVEPQPLASYFSRLNVTLEKGIAIHGVYTKACDATRTLLMQLNNTVQISHVFPDVARGASSSVITKMDLVPDTVRGGLYNLPRGATDEDIVAALVAQFTTGLSVHLFIENHFRYTGGHRYQRRDNNINNTSKPLALYDLMNPQGFDFRFGDGLLITPGTK